MRLYDHDAELDFRDGGEVWIHWKNPTPPEVRGTKEPIQVELTREFLEPMMAELDRLLREGDLFMKAEDFATKYKEEYGDCRGVLEDFILFAHEER